MFENPIELLLIHRFGHVKVHVKTLILFETFRDDREQNLVHLMAQTNSLSSNLCLPNLTQNAVCLSVSADRIKSNLYT